MGSLWRWRRREQDLDDEIAAHFRMAVADRVARGESEKQARAAVHREFGSEALVKEVTRGEWGGARVADALRDLRLTMRTLARSPRFTLASVLCMALGVGATMTVFSAVHSILLRPLPYPGAPELVALRAVNATWGAGGATVSQEVLDAWRSASTLSEVATWRSGSRDLTEGEHEPQRVEAASVTANLMPLLGVAPLHGRMLHAADEMEGAGDVVILGHDLWQTRYGGDPAIVGAVIQVGGRPHEVAGVMPAGFSFPEGATLWTPLIAPPLPPDVLFYDGALARLAGGADAEGARMQVNAIMSVLRAERGYEGWSFVATSLHDDLVGALRRPILLLQGAALLVLLVACANIATLLLARSAARQRELALRAALGARRGRLVAHVLLECLALGLIGGALGTTLAWGGVQLLTLAFPDGVPSYLDLSLHTPVLLLTLVVTLGAVALFGVVPALRAGAVSADDALPGGARVGALADRRGRSPGALVAAEIAVSVVLLAAALLLVRTHQALENSLGFRHEGVLMATVQLPMQRYRTADERDGFRTELAERLAHIPGVDAVSGTLTPPLLHDVTTGRWGFRHVDAAQPSSHGDREQVAALHYMAPGYLATIGAPIVMGRDIQATDAASGVVTAVVNESFARRYFPGGDVLGRRIAIESAPGRLGPTTQIVGVVRDIRHVAPPAELDPAIYAQHPRDMPTTTFMLRTSVPDPAALAPAVRQAVRDIDRALIVGTIQSHTSLVERAFWKQRLQRNVIAVFAGMALLLALFGVYGVLSYAISERTAEFGVRMALGASAGQLLLHVFQQAARLAGLGLVVGLVAAAVLTRLLRGLLYGVEPYDPASLAGAALVLFVVAMAAAAVPAWRASRLDPQQAIRSG